MKISNEYREIWLEYHQNEAVKLYNILNGYNPELLKNNNITQPSDLVPCEGMNYVSFLNSRGTIVTKSCPGRVGNHIVFLRENLKKNHDFLIIRQTWGIKDVIKNGWVLRK